MTPTLTIALKDLRLLLRDPRSAVVLLVMPLLLILVLGLSLGDAFGAKPDDRIRISVVNLDAGLPPEHGPFPPGKWSDQVLADLTDTADIRVEYIRTEEEALQLVRRGDRSAVVVFGPRFSEFAHRCSFVDEPFKKEPINPLFRDGVQTSSLDVKFVVNPTQPVAASVIQQVVQVTLLRVVIPWMIGQAFDMIGTDPFMERMEKHIPELKLAYPFVSKKRLGKGIQDGISAFFSKYSFRAKTWAGLTKSEPPQPRAENRTAYEAGDSGVFGLNRGAARYQILVPSYTVTFAFFLVLTVGWLFVAERRHGTLVRLRAGPLADPPRQADPVPRCVAVSGVLPAHLREARLRHELGTGTLADRARRGEHVLRRGRTRHAGRRGGPHGNASRGLRHDAGTGAGRRERLANAARPDARTDAANQPRDAACLGFGSVLATPGQPGAANGPRLEVVWRADRVRRRVLATRVVANAAGLISDVPLWSVNMAVRGIVLLLLIGAVGCGSKVQTSTSTPTKEVATSKPVTPKESPPDAITPKETPASTPPVTLGKTVPIKLYAAGLMATADAPAGTDVRGEASFQMTLGFRKDFDLYISPGKKPFAEVLAEAKKHKESKFLAEDKDGFVTELFGNSGVCQIHRQVAIDGVVYEMSSSSSKKPDALLAYAVARSVRQTPEDADAVKKTEAAWKKLAEDDKSGLHPGDGVIARSEDKPTDASFAALKDIAYIKQLNMNAGGTVTAAGLHTGLGPNVFGFRADGDWFNDSLAKALTGNTTLKSLTLDSKSLSDEGATHLTGLTNVWYASLNTPNLTDQSAAVFLPTMAKLEMLSISSPKLTNAFLPALSKLDRLEDLNLTFTGVTDDAVPDIAKIPNLKSVTVRRTKMTAEGVAKLKAAKKGLRVYSDFDK